MSPCLTAPQSLPHVVHCLASLCGLSVTNIPHIFTTCAFILSLQSITGYCKVTASRRFHTAFTPQPEAHRLIAMFLQLISSQLLSQLPHYPSNHHPSVSDPQRKLINWLQLSLYSSQCWSNLSDQGATNRVLSRAPKHYYSL